MRTVSRLHASSAVAVSARRNETHSTPGRSTRPADYVLVAALGACALLWTVTGVPLLPLRPWFIAYFVQINLFVMMGICCLFMARVAHCMGRHGRLPLGKFRASARRHFGADTVVHWFRYAVLFVIVITLHTSLKQAIPFINPAVWDAPLIAVERLVHGGWNPAWDVLAVDAPRWWIGLLDTSYFLWFPVMPLTAAYFLTHRVRKKRDRYFAAFLGVWLIGVLMGLAVPSHGPCYVDPERFPAQGMIIARRIQFELWEHYTSLGSITPTGDGGLVFGFGLMAMPSLHVTVCCLYVIYFWHEGRGWRWTSIAFAVLIFLGSLYSGWHYAIDGYAGLVIALLAAWLARRLPNGASDRRGLGTRWLGRRTPESGFCCS